MEGGRGFELPSSCSLYSQFLSLLQWFLQFCAFSINNSTISKLAIVPQITDSELNLLFCV